MQAIQSTNRNWHYVRVHEAKRGNELRLFFIILLSGCTVHDVLFETQMKTAVTVPLQSIISIMSDVFTLPSAIG